MREKGLEAYDWDALCSENEDIKGWLSISQKGHRRVQIFPMIRKVARLPLKHSPRFGQQACSQTVVRVLEARRFLTSFIVCLLGEILIFSHSGFLSFS